MSPKDLIKVSFGSLGDAVRGGPFLPLPEQKADIAARRSFRAAATGLVDQAVLGRAKPKQTINDDREIVVRFVE